jgi:hypothetical protein
MAREIRIPFADAIAEQNLLRPWFSMLSLAQQTSLKIAYGCPLSADKQDDRGWSELDYYYMLAGSCTYDALGYLKTVTPLPYVPQEYPEVWMVWGVRAGKSDMAAATIIAYESTCGGHEAYARPGRPIIVFQIAADLRLAKYSLHSIKGAIDQMPWCKDWIKQVTADRIDLSNGVTIAVTPPTVKSIRGYDSPAATLDEVGVWYVEADSANPDSQVYSQVTSRQAQFANPKIVGISSPWAMQGLLYDRHMAGTNGCHIFCDEHRKTKVVADCPACRSLRIPHQGRLVMHGTTASLGNPLIRKTWLQSQLNADPRSFARECLAQFQESISGFLDAGRVEEAVQHGLLERPPEPGKLYLAAMDPAFRRDTFAVTICHADEQLGIIQDVSRRWVPPPGLPLNPETIIASELVPLMKQYRVLTIATDQYQFESLQQLALKHGLALDPTDFTASSKSEIWGNFKGLVNRGRIQLLDVPEQTRELKQLEAKLSPAGNVQISAPEGQHDDLATVIALAANRAVWMLPAADVPPPKVPTIKDEIDAQVMKKLHDKRFAQSDAEEYGDDSSYLADG